MSRNVKFNSIEVDGTLASNSDSKWPSAKAVKTYVDSKTSASTTLAKIVSSDSNLVVSVNTDSIVQDTNITLSLATQSEIVAGDNIVVSANTNSIFGTDVTVSLATGISVESLNISTTETPATSVSAGALGDIAFDNTYLYVCNKAGSSWSRVTLSWIGA